MPYFLSTNYGLAGDDAGYLSSVFDLAGFFGTIAAGFLSDKLFDGRRAVVSMMMLMGMVVGCGMLMLASDMGVVAIGVSLALIGFMLFGPDSLLTGAGAMDIGSRRAALAAAGIINGMGSIGAMVQELVVGRLFDQNSGDVGPVLVLLFGASICSVLFIGVILWRNKCGVSDL